MRTGLFSRSAWITNDFKLEAHWIKLLVCGGISNFGATKPSSHQRDAKLESYTHD
jgi:hypothetical protein